MCGEVGERLAPRSSASVLPVASSSSSSSMLRSKWSSRLRLPRPVMMRMSSMPARDGLLDHVLDRRLVDDRQHLLRLRLRRREESGAEAGSGNHRLANLHRSTLHVVHYVRTDVVGILGTRPCRVPDRRSRRCPPTNTAARTVGNISRSCSRSPTTRSPSAPLAAAPCARCSATSASRSRARASTRPTAARPRSSASKSSNSDSADGRLDVVGRREAVDAEVDKRSTSTTRRRSRSPTQSELRARGQDGVTDG